ncbi:MAG: DUF5787 family protein [Haloarculaceae archaeon]
MREFPFELALCARLESPGGAVVGRQLGAALHGTRVIDVALVYPGPEFRERAAITAETIPPAAIEADVGAGEARPIRRAFPGTSRRWARGTVEAAVDAGFFEVERRGGREYVRQTVRYPDWFGRIVGVENKPDLDRPGDLELQLRKDVSLGLFDGVVLATASHVTGAHLNRIPPEVGVWRFDPGTGERRVVREPTPLDSDGPGIEVLESHPARTEVRPATGAEKARQRRRLAERAYGKGWRIPGGSFPGCAACASGERFGAGALPDCAWKGRLVDPSRECGSSCPGYEPADPPATDVRGERARNSPWEPAPEGRTRRQAGLDRFVD